MTLLTNWQLELTTDDILRGQGADPGILRRRRPGLVAAAAAALAEGVSLLEPAAEVHQLPVRSHRHAHLELGRGRLSGARVVQHLAGAERVAVVVCTIGPQLEAHVSGQFDRQPLLAMALDGLGNAAVEQLAQQVCSQLAAQAEAQGLTCSTPLSPGDAGWPVEVGQAQVFGLLEQQAPAGIRLTESGMMLPRKSISFVVGIGPQMARTKICELCDLKDRCRYRHA